MKRTVKTNISIESLYEIGDNREQIRRILTQIETGREPVPFVGAGISMPCGFPGWTQFLLQESKHLAAFREIKSLVQRWQYEEAADVMAHHLGERGLLDKLEKRFGMHLLTSEDSVIRGAVRLLPTFSNGPVVTTNYDRLLEHVFARSSNPFEQVLWGARVDTFSEIITQHRRCLFKIHGDVQDRIDRVLTLTDYERMYGNRDIGTIDLTRPLPNVLQRLFLGVPLLFIGCSLSNDRTLQLLTRIARENQAAVRHYAILAMPQTKSAWNEKERFLNDVCIRPIWYPPGQHQSVEIILAELISKRGPRSPDGTPGPGSLTSTGTPQRSVLDPASNSAPVQQKPRIMSATISATQEMTSVAWDVAPSSKLGLDTLDPAILITREIKKNTTERDEAEPSLRTVYSFLNEEELLHLALIAESPLSPSVKILNLLMPSIKWRMVLSGLRTRKLVEYKTDSYVLTRSSRRLLEKNESIKEQAVKNWIAELEPLKDFSDTGFLLFIMYFRAKLYDKSVEQLCDLLDTFDDSGYGRTALERFYPVLEKLRYSARLETLLGVGSCVRIMNSMGLCLSHLGRNKEAIEKFVALQHYALERKHSWGLCHSYINCGVSYHNTGDLLNAKRCYELAIQYARSADDKSILAKALSNLAQTVMDLEGPTTSVEGYLKETTQLRRSLRERDSAIGLHTSWGRFYAEKGLHKRALREFEKSYTASKKLGLHRGMIASLRNIAKTHEILSTSRLQVKYIREALMIAKKGSYEDQIRECIQSEGVFRVHLKQYKRAADLFGILAQLEAKVGDSNAEVRAMHDRASCLLGARDYKACMLTVKDALEKSIRYQVYNHMPGLYLLLARSEHRKLDGLLLIEKLSEYTHEEHRRGRHMVALRLSIQALIQSYPNLMTCKQVTDLEKEIERRCEKGLPETHKTEIRIDLLRFKYIRSREMKQYDECLNIIRSIRNEANITDSEVVSALIEEGNCLNKLSRPDDAIKAYQEAAGLARSMFSISDLAKAALNIAETYRRSEQYVSSMEELSRLIPVLEEHGDQKILLAFHTTKALALIGMKQFKTAQILLTQINTKAKQHRLLHEEIRALMALALLKTATSAASEVIERLYRSAIAKAKKGALLDDENEAVSCFQNFLLNRYFVALDAEDEKEFEKLANRYLKVAREFELMEGVEDVIISYCRYFIYYNEKSSAIRNITEAYLAGCTTIMTPGALELEPLFHMICLFSTELWRAEPQRRLHIADQIATGIKQHRELKKQKSVTLVKLLLVPTATVQAASKVDNIDPETFSKISAQQLKAAFAKQRRRSLAAETRL